MIHFISAICYFSKAVIDNCNYISKEVIADFLEHVKVWCNGTLRVLKLLVGTADLVAIILVHYSETTKPSFLLSIPCTVPQHTKNTRSMGNVKMRLNR